MVILPRSQHPIVCGAWENALIKLKMKVQVTTTAVLVFILIEV
jgi:hypothetical protein